MIAVGYLHPADCWDSTLIADLLNGTLYPHGLDIQPVDGYPDADGCILVIPGRYYADDERIADIDDAIARYEWVLGIRIGDEEDLFDIHQVAGPERMRWWVQTPRADRDYGDARLFGVGFTPHLRYLPADPPEKTTDVFLAAQNTHERRRECFAAIQPGKSRKLVPTEGFTQGLPPAEYAEQMVRAKVAPCPSGPASPDSFRVWEALQAHAIPIADDITPGYDSAGYFNKLYPDAPFPILQNYSDLPGYIEDQLGEWPMNANRIVAWWMRQRREMSRWLVDDLKALGAC
ncbi:hypothetical protein [Mycobacterium kansasii]|uniref:hypothetical protein n=1 Tax=Mycobacterium kansasii TaxID=1768 RepID=UPI0009EF7179|nr:hypothetical protein [Mycobacterium kansasii]ARG91414.1 hypothetical protein B1T50_04680 [Mycobacterium kansasii]